MKIYCCSQIGVPCIRVNHNCWSLVAKRSKTLHFFCLCSCEQTLFNAPGEALALTDAARLFLASEQETRALRAPGFDENMQAAMNCYSFAIKVFNAVKFIISDS